MVNSNFKRITLECDDAGNWQCRNLNYSTPHYGLIFIFQLGINRLEPFVRLSTVGSERYAEKRKNKLLFIAFMERVLWKRLLNFGSWEDDVGGVS